MTGFGRAESEHDGWSWSWEIKSVNNKAFDIRVRIPSGYELLEPRVRREAQGRFKRGALYAVLSIVETKPFGAGSNFQINRTLLHELVEIVHEYEGREVVNIESLLNVRGVVEKFEDPEDETEKGQRLAQIMQSFETALNSLQEDRTAEGEKLKKILRRQLKDLSDCIEAAVFVEDQRGEKKTERVKAQLAEILKAKPPISEDRLLQELAVMAIKADITEELDRLRAHLISAREIIDDTKPKGRRLDFLCQEFNREANTICAKSNDIELTKHGLQMKALIEQFREQVQNVE